MASICHLRTPEEYASLLSLYDTWLFDCDGVLWNGDELIDGAVQVLEMLRQQSIKSIFVFILSDSDFFFSVVFARQESSVRLQ